MNRKTRRTLFVIAVVAFLAVGFVITMYAQGYRWDFKANRFLLAGAVYVETITPDNADISVNNKPANKTTAALIKNLLPLRKYEVKVAKADYQSWAKEFEIEPGFVVQAKNIVLFPTELKTQIILPDNSVTDFSVSPDQRHLITNSGNKQFTLRLITEPSATATPINFTDKKRTAAVGFLKNGGSWSANSKKFILWRETYGLNQLIKNWFIWDSETKTLTDLTSLYERKIVLKNASAAPLPTKFNPSGLKWLGNDNDLGVIIGGQLLRLDLKNETVTDLNLSDIIDFDFKDSKIVALKNPDILMFMDSAIQNVSVLGQINISASSDGTVGANRVTFSPQGDKVLYAGPKALGVLWLKETTDQPLRKTNDMETIYETSQTINDAYWHNSGEYVIFLENQVLKTAELDGRGQRNIAAWINAISALNYLSENQKLFLLESGSIKSVIADF